MKLAEGAPAPAFSLPDQHGTPWSLEDHRGSPVVLYFYPKDATPGCTTQACDVRDHWDQFAELGVEVAGVSPDDVGSHAAFAARHELPHTLLADPERTVIERYGAWGEKKSFGKTYQGVIRSSVVIDADGKVAAVFDRIKPEQQSARALEVVRSL